MHLLLVVAAAVAAAATVASHGTTGNNPISIDDVLSELDLSHLLPRFRAEGVDTRGLLAQLVKDQVNRHGLLKEELGVRRLGERLALIAYVEKAEAEAAAPTAAATVATKQQLQLRRTSQLPAGVGGASAWLKSENAKLVFGEAGDTDLFRAGAGHLKSSGKLTLDGQLCLGGSCISEFADGSPWAEATAGNIARASGKVGIGTMHPAHELHILNNQNTGTISLIQNLDAGAGAHVYWRTQSNDGNLYGIMSSTAGGGGATIYTDAGTGKFTIKTFNPIPLTFGTNNAGKMTIDASGNVGIGTVLSPKSKLHVTGGDIEIGSMDTRGPNDDGGFIPSGRLLFKKCHTTGCGSGTGGYHMGAIGTYTSNGYAGGLAFYGGEHVGGGSYDLQHLASPTMVVGTTNDAISAGRVGIGTTSPTQPLEVRGADSGIKISSAQANRPHLRFECGTTEKLMLSANSNYGAIGDGSNANRYMIFQDGTVAVGGSPFSGALADAKLHVVGGWVKAKGFQTNFVSATSLPYCVPATDGLIILTQGASSDQILCYCHDSPAGQGGRRWTNLVSGSHGSATACPGDTSYG